jgi:hypothetical protein
MERPHLSMARGLRPRLLPTLSIDIKLLNFGFVGRRLNDIDARRLA